MELEPGMRHKFCKKTLRLLWFEAERKQDVWSLRRLSEQNADVECRDQDHGQSGATALYRAARAVRLQSLQMILRLKADVENGCLSSLHGSNCTPLLVAAEKGRSAVIAELAAARAKVNAVDPTFGVTALASTIEHTHLEAMHKLIASSADVNALASTEDRCTPLLLALKLENSEAAQALLKAKANMDKMDSAGLTPLMAAACQPMLVGTLHAMLSRKCWVNEVDRRARSALWWAAYKGNVQVSSFCSRHARIPTSQAK